GGRGLPGPRDQPGDVLRLEEALCRPGRDRAARAAPVAGRKRAAETSGGGFVARSADPAGDRLKKALKPRLRRKLAEWAQLAYRISERRAVRLMRMVRSSQRYRSRKDPQLALRGKLKELASTHVRYGYRRLTVLLRRQGWKVNAKRIYRLYTEEGLIVRTKQRVIEGEGAAPKSITCDKAANLPVTCWKPG